MAGTRLCSLARRHQTIDGAPLGESRDQREATAHGLAGLAHRQERQVARLFQPRDAVLGDPEFARKANLGELLGLAEFAQRCLLGDEFCRASTGRPA